MFRDDFLHVFTPWWKILVEPFLMIVAQIRREEVQVGM
jgi:hypothetical protein